MGKYSLEELKARKSKELIKVASEFNITGRWDMKKDELIDSIMKAQECDSLATETVKDESANVPVKEVAESCEKETVGKAANVLVNPQYAESPDFFHRPNIKYLENLQVDDIVAFYVYDGSLFLLTSAKVVELLDSDDWNIPMLEERIRVETVRGNSYILTKSDIVWVRGRGACRWPSSLYRMFKAQRERGLN